MMAGFVLATSASSAARPHAQKVTIGESAQLNTMRRACRALLARSSLRQLSR